MTQAPHIMTNAPHIMTKAPHKMMKAPHIMTKAPHIMMKAPHIMTKAPHIMTKAPHIMTKAPHIMSTTYNVKKNDHLRQSRHSIYECKTLFRHPSLEQLYTGASVTKWLNHLPFTSEVAGPILSCASYKVTQTDSLCEKNMSTLCRKFPLDTPVSPHR